MGFPKAVKSRMNQGVWRRRIGAPFAVVLVAAVFVVVAFSGQFAQGPDVHVDNTLRPARDMPVSTDQELEISDSSKQEEEGSDQKFELGESPNKEAIEEQKPSQTATSDQEDNTLNPETKRASEDTTPANDTVGEGGTATTTMPTQEDERVTRGSESLGKKSPPQDQEGEKGTTKAGPQE